MFICRLTPKARKWQWAIKKVIDQNRRARGEIGMQNVLVSKNAFEKSKRDADADVLSDQEQE